MAIVLLAACGAPEDEAPAEAAAGANELVLVHRAILFSREVEGVSEGFDLDAEVTTIGGATGCGVGDFTSADGTPGIDNAFARMIPALEATEAVAVETLIQQTVNAGDLLILTRLTGVDDPMDDDAVDLEVFRGLGAPLLGSDGQILPFQTFDVDTASPVSLASGLRLEGGRIQADALALQLPIQIFDVFLDLHLENASFRVTAPSEEGGVWTGLMAGGVPTLSIQAVADEEDVDDALSGLVAALLAANADLAATSGGTCEQLSMTFATEAVEGFVYAE